MEGEQQPAAGADLPEWARERLRAEIERREQAEDALALAVQRAAEAERRAEAAESAAAVRADAERERLARQIDQQRQFLQSVLDNAPAGIVVLDGRDLRVRWANQSYRAFLDEPYRSMDLAGLRIQDFIPRAEASGVAGVFRRVAETGVPHTDTEYEHFGFTRGVTYWRWTLLPLPPDEDGVSYLMLLVVEVTESVLARKQMEQLRDQAEALVAELYAANNDLHAREELLKQVEQRSARLASFPERNPNPVVEVDAAGNVAYANPAARSLWPDLCATHPFVANLPAVMAQLRSEGLHTIDREVLCDGKTYHQTLCELRESGCVRIYSSDITARRLAQDALARQQRLLDAIFDNILAQVAYLDKDLNFVRVNAAYCGGCGYQAEELVGRNHFDLFPHEENRRIFERVIETGEPYVARAKPFEFPNEPERGVTYWDWWLRPIRDPEGETEGVVLSLVDVTTTERARRQVESFLALLGHELRNPLGAVSCALQVLRQCRHCTDAMQRAVNVAARQSAHMARLVDDLLDVARITHGKIDLRRRRLDLCSVVGDAIEATAPVLRAREHQLTVSLPSAPLCMDADADRITQILGNLLTNAAKYTPNGGRVWVTLSREEGEAVLRVRDSGEGIPAHALTSVFEPFVQAHGAKEGLGIGLTLVKRLVELHGGRVEAYSAGVGQGCEFVVRLPAPEPALAEAAPTNPLPAAEAAGRLRILLVEDNTDIAEVTAMLLDGLGHEVVVAFDGPAALRRIAEQMPEVVICDLGLPGGMSGLDVARRIRERESQPQPLLIALSGFGQEEDRRNTREAGFDHHLTKPLEFARLERLLAACAVT